MSGTANLRVGQGFDVHRFGPGDHVMLGGVRISHDRGVIAHSDGDVLLHALTDALFGAAGLGDIGLHFPDTDPRYAGADSRKLLADAVDKLRERGGRVVNADVTIVAERPRVAGHAQAMRSVIAPLLGVAESAVSIKASTVEKMGFIGRDEGLAALAVVLLAMD